MHIVNLQEARDTLAELAEEAARGEEIVIAVSGKLRVKLVPVEMERQARKPGSLKGKIRIAPDFDAPLPDDVQSAFEGR
ncbi:type II toxin-antitoxin system Phd/YefM family antitoxin [Noviherbaspirillum pedocola]|uniref:Antitoxin n=1 Tax=Noviherbaspirillum pedocola TaxID=2801341 RepID=A0A934T1B7_9BURK|nr:type II toxin-antitoxin system prevent-host-death family antitoxin [Noviherbaspirillum pedocola]MBK4737147.1 type II toxin-antitoxin system prevent-host-death family antitoxin [Noviherbaspirillum pedocola]